MAFLQLEQLASTYEHVWPLNASLSASSNLCRTRRLLVSEHFVFPFVCRGKYI